MEQLAEARALDFALPDQTPLMTLRKLDATAIRSLLYRKLFGCSPKTPEPQATYSRLLSASGMRPSEGVGNPRCYATPDQHRLFFSALPFVVVATVDDAGWPLATMLAGAPGFITSPNAKTLNIEALPQADGPLYRWLRTGAPIGILGIDLATRRRNRANGFVAGVDMDGFTVSVRESFGNCPQYIHVRDATFERSVAQPTETLEVLDPAAHAAITAADTLFVATTGGGEGVDISHRAGKPDFVQINGNTLTIPDYAGNRYFNTLGNLLLDARAALLFPDFTNGDLLLVQGSTEIVWEIPPEERASAAAPAVVSNPPTLQRSITLAVTLKASIRYWRAINNPLFERLAAGTSVTLPLSGCVEY